MLRGILSTLLGLCTASLLVGCAGQTLNEGWLEAGERSYEAARYDEAITKLTQYIESDPPAEDLGRAYYVRALSFAKSNRRSLAHEDLLHCFQTARDPDVVWRSCVLLGTLYYEDEKWANAAHAYTGAITRMQEAPPLDDVLWRLGVCHERMGQWGQSRTDFQRLVLQFPNSRLANDARRRLAISADHFAIQCGVFSSQTSADELTRQLARQGMSAYTRREPRDGALKNVVLVGRYTTYEEAWQDIARVRQYVPGAVIWP
ncbi:MAG: SPOR domain-containing protein [Phycisphaerae bacterium]|nr:SPOR domain-containing protein [Phycisphaerae bacterium]